MPESPSAPLTGGRPVILIDIDAPTRLVLAAQCGLRFLPFAIKQKLSSVLSPESMVVVAASNGVPSGAHAIGAGFAVNVVMDNVTVAVLGAESIEAAKRLRTFYGLAMTARHKPDLDKAGREFASFVTAVGVNVALVMLTRMQAQKLPRFKPIELKTMSLAWANYIEWCTPLVSPRNKGMLWTKIDEGHADRLAESNGLTSLQMLLRREGFTNIYAKQFGSFVNVRGAGLQDVTAIIWRDVSRRFAAFLTGKVTAFVGQGELKRKISLGEEPVLVDELWEITEAIEDNPNITSVQMSDVFSRQTWVMLPSDVLRSGASRPS